MSFSFISVCYTVSRCLCNSHRFAEVTSSASRL